MQILHLISGLKSGGAEGVLFKLIKHDKKNIHHVIAFSDGFYFNQLKKSNINVHVLKLKNIFFLINFLKLIFLIRKKNPDLIQSWMYHADFITILLKIFFIKKKIYWNLRNTLPNLEFSSLSSVILSKICAFFSNFIPTKIIACAHSVSLQHQKIGYSKNKIHIVFNGFDSINFKKDFKIREKLRRKLDIKKKDFIIGCFARYHPQKSHETLIESYNFFSKSYENSKLLLVGENLPKSLIKRVKNVIIVKPSRNINKLYSVLDLFILPSIGYEGFPNVLAEAMLSEVFCISTDVGDSKKIINKYGLIFKKRNTKDLNKKIFLSLKLKNSVLNKKARKYIMKNFNIKNMVKEYNSIWNIK